MANNDDTQTLIQLMSCVKKLNNSKTVENITNELVGLREQYHENRAVIGHFTKENVNLTQQTEAAAEEIRRLKEDVDRLQVELVHNRNDLVEIDKLANDRGQKLREETAKVTQLKQYRVDLKIESRRDVGARWIKLWSVVNELAIDFFSEDLDLDILQAAAANEWEPSTGRQYSKDFPSPATNTKEAKQMRIIAVDSIIASALARCIFRPVVTENGFAKAILAHESPDMEASYRSFHLAAMDKLPGYRNPLVDRAVKAAVAEVIDSVGQILTEDGTKEFRISLEDVCRTVEREWRGFQQYNERYEVDMAGTENCYDYVPLWQPAEPSSSPRTNGAGKKPAQDEARNGQKAERAPAPKRKEKSAVLVACVWPLLKVVDASGAAPKIAGLALFSSQSGEAEEQVKRVNRKTDREEGKKDEKTNSSRPMSIVNFLPSSPKSS